MAYEYDDQNIFAKILRAEIPNTTVMETEHCLAFRDINPLLPEHILIIPKGPYVNYDHFALLATDTEIVDFTRTIGKVCDAIGVSQYQTQANMAFKRCLICMFISWVEPAPGV